MQLIRLVPAALGVALLYGATVPVDAASNVITDARRGFSIKLPEPMKQIPPKPTGDPRYQAVKAFDDQAKWKGLNVQNPEFYVTWWSTPKASVTPSKGSGATSDGSNPAGGGAPPPDVEERPERFSNVDELIDTMIESSTDLFGTSKPPMADRWDAAKTGATTKQKIEFKYLELNFTKPKRKGDPDPKWFIFVAKLKLERPTESVVVAFHGFGPQGSVNDLVPNYMSVVKSFETKDASNAKEAEVPTDPKQFVDFVIKTKVTKGWKWMKSPKEQYLLLYDEGVKDDLIHEIGMEIEAIRAQVYEKLFPPDKPVTAVSVIRVCKDPEEYSAYGGPSGSAGYWAWSNQELVFYKDSKNPDDALRVLYHEAFHQYIFYSVGALSPHSWFNEGHGDYFAGHNYKNGHFECAEFLWRRDLAKKIKREKRTVPLKDWLRWGQPQYYGSNKNGLDGGDNYALGWNFIYFLRTTKKAEYQGLLDRYFNKLKSLVTAEREARKKAHDKAVAEGTDPGPDVPESVANMQKEDGWCETALNEMLKGVDVDQLEKDWLAF